jgi:hypothetical protein
MYAHELMSPHRVLLKCTHAYACTCKCMLASTCENVHAHAKLMRCIMLKSNAWFECIHKYTYAGGDRCMLTKHIVL